MRMKHIAAVAATVQMILMFTTLGTPAGKESQMETGKPVVIQSAVDAFNALKFPEAFKEEKKLVDGKEVFPSPHAHFWFHLVQMQAAGWKDADIDTIVAISGASALLGYEQNSFMPKYAFHHVKGNHIERATGFGYEWVQYKDVEGAWNILKESLDSGRPVSAAHMEDILFAGYEDAAKTEDRKVFAISLEPDQYAKWWTWKEFNEWANSHGRSNGSRMGRYTKRAPVEEPKSIALRVIHNLVAWSDVPPENVQKAFPNSEWGLSAVAKCAQLCGDLKNREKWGICHELNSQWPTKKSSAVYLEKVVKNGLFSNEINKHLTAAAESYREAYEQWVIAYRQVSWGGPKGGAKKQETRKVAAEALRKAGSLEKAAIDNLKAALALITE